MLEVTTMAVWIVFGRAFAGIQQSERNKESAAHSVCEWASTVGGSSATGARTSSSSGPSKWQHGDEHERAHASPTTVQRRTSADAAAAATARADDARAGTATAGLRGSSDAATATTTNAGRPRWSATAVGSADAAAGHATSSAVQSGPSRVTHGSPSARVPGRSTRGSSTGDGHGGTSSVGQRATSTGHAAPSTGHAAAAAAAATTGAATRDASTSSRSAGYASSRQHDGRPGWAAASSTGQPG